jgi:hypothetical protein
MLIDIVCHTHDCPGKQPTEVLVSRSDVQLDGAVPNMPCPHCNCDRYKVLSVPRTSFMLSDKGAVGWASTKYATRR